jgi:hypothetical protein
MRVLVAALFAVVVAALPVQAAAVDRQSYTSAVAQARQLVEEARNGRPAAATEAYAVLKAGTGESLQPVLDDLSHDPPLLDDAQTRLDAASAALSRPGVDANPEVDKHKLDAILAEPRYASLRSQPPNFLQDFLDWLARTLSSWLSSLPLGRVQLPEVPLWIWVTILVAVVLAALGAGAYFFRPGFRHTAETTAEPDTPAVVRRRADDAFAAAERLAAEGDYDGALRSLVAAVATRLSGRVFWASSPLTVREMLRDKGELENLRPLLIAFERSVYGRKPATAADYQAAAALAQRFREAPEDAAA